MEREILTTSPRKKHKKHKHKKHKKKRTADQDGEEGSGYGSPEASVISESVKPALKLKIKIGGQTLGEKSVVKAEIPEPSSEDSESVVVDDRLSPSQSSNSATMPTLTGVGPGHSCVGSEEEEEAWLEALESGRLEEVDEELKKMRDPTFMTARQKALLENKSKEKDDPPPPTVYPEKPMTEEMMQRRMMRAKKRKQQAEEKREKDKKQTIERLLKKTDAKVKGSKYQQKLAKKSQVPKLSCIRNHDGVTLSLPLGYQFPIISQTFKQPPSVVKCGIIGCNQPKKYSCSKTGVPLCSLQCYKKNLVAFQKTVHNSVFVT